MQKNICVRYLRPALLLCLLVLAVPVSSHADVTLSFLPIEEAKFLVRGTGWERGAAVHLTVDYDTTYLATPEATAMGGRLRLDGTPGRLQLDVLNEEQSPLFEVCIFFRKLGEFPAVINFVTAELTDQSGVRHPAAVSMLANPNTAGPQPGESAAEILALNANLQGGRDE